jgi:predicted acetyltransferase
MHGSFSPVAKSLLFYELCSLILVTGAIKMNFTVERIQPENRAALDNMVKMYCCEWSQYNQMDMDENGCYPFEKYVGFYFTKPHRDCWYLRADGKLAGFALIDDDFAVGGDSEYSMGEFFVIPKYRRLGAGRFLAETLFNQYPGKWEVGFHPHNIASVKFWTKVISEYTHGACVLHESCTGLDYQDGTLGSVLTFCSGE